MKLKLIFLSALLVMTAIYAAQAQVKSGAYRTMLRTLLSHSVPEISVEKAKNSTGTIFLDAREPNEYEVSHIKDAHFVGYDHFAMDSVAGIAKDTPIIVYCSVGYRSEKISEKLIAAGYTRVSNLYGGIFEWVNEDQPVVDDKGTTENVHAFNRKWGIWLKKGKKVY